jgi:hypothetical protein
MSSNNKEEFCGACLAVPLAMAGVGSAAGASGSSKKKIKKYVFWGSIILSVISLLAAVYFLKKCKTCKI